jgi:hypothetical protein
MTPFAGAPRRVGNPDFSYHGELQPAHCQLRCVVQHGIGHVLSLARKRQLNKERAGTAMSQPDRRRRPALVGKLDWPDWVKGGVSAQIPITWILTEQVRDP